MSLPSGRVRLLLKSRMAHCVLQLMGAEGPDRPTQQTDRCRQKPGEVQNSGDGGSFSTGHQTKLGSKLP